MPRKNAKKTNSSENDGQEFFAAIAQIEKEKGIPAGYMMEKITQALASAYKRDHEGAGDNIEVKANPETGQVRMFILKDIVETVDNPATEMSLEEARRAGGCGPHRGQAQELWPHCRPDRPPGHYPGYPGSRAGHDL